MTPLENLRTQLRMVVDLRRQIAEKHDYPFLCMEDFILKHGRVFEPSPMPPPITPIPKACFQQCYRLTQRRRSRWIYCEGYAVPKTGLAVHHAWVVRHGVAMQAVDLAWDDDLSGECAYIGIPFQRDFVRRMHVLSGREFFSVLDAWWAKFPLLTGEVDLDEAFHPLHGILEAG